MTRLTSAKRNLSERTYSDNHKLAPLLRVTYRECVAAKRHVKTRPACNAFHVCRQMKARYRRLPAATAVFPVRSAIFRGGLFRQRQGQAKPGATEWRRQRLQAAAVQRRYALCDGQAQPTDAAAGAFDRRVAQ